MDNIATGTECLLGAGQIFIDVLDDGARTGEVFLGDCSVFQIEPSGEEVTHKSSVSRDRAVIASAIIGRSLALKITGHQFNKANIARVLGGDAGTLTQTTDDVAAEEIDGVKQGRFYSLLYRDVTDVVVKGPSGTPTYDVTDDYEVDADSGRIYIVPGGGIADDSDIEVDYTYATIALPKASGMNQLNLKAFIRFKGDPSSGPIWEVQVWRVNLVGDGALDLIGDTFGSWGLKGTIESDAANHPTETHFSAVQTGTV